LISRVAVLISRVAVLISRVAVLINFVRSTYGVRIRFVCSTWRFPSFVPTQIEVSCCNVGTYITSIRHNHSLFYINECTF
jgi:hypothetical protein